MNVYSISEGRPSALKQVRVKDEDKELQEAIEKNPAILPGDQIEPEDPRRWLIVTREMPVPDPASGGDHWSLDFLLADHKTTPTFVECKRFDAPDARRKVIGQMLDYAANGAYYWTLEQLRGKAAETARKQGRDLEAALQQLSPDEQFRTPEKFFELFCEKLKQGEVRLVFFLEESSHELRSVADFLNRQMESAEVLVVEARQYEHKDERIVVPVLIGYTDAIRNIKKAVTVSESSAKALLTVEQLLQRIRAKNPENVSTLAKDLIEGMASIGMTTRGLPTGVNYGVEAREGFTAILSLYPGNFGFNIPLRATAAMNSERLTQWKQDLNDKVATFYKEANLSDPSNRGALAPNYSILPGKIEALLNAITDIKTQVEQALANTAQ